MADGRPDWASAWFDAIPEMLPANATVGVELNGLVYACHLAPDENADRLAVYLAGGAGAEMARPVITGLGLGKRLDAHFLVISDPSLFLDMDLRNGVFLGEHGNDPMEGALAITRSVARSLGVAKDRIVFWGASGSGFAALSAATRTGAAAITYNAQTNLEVAKSRASESILARRFLGDSRWEEIGGRFTNRVNMGRAFQAAVGRGEGPRIALLQNRRDSFHYERHFVPFCEASGAPSEGGLSADGLVRSQVLDHPGGHNISGEAIQQMVAAMSHVLPERA